MLKVTVKIGISIGISLVKIGISIGISLVKIGISLCTQNKETPCAIPIYKVLPYLVIHMYMYVHIYNVPLALSTVHTPDTVPRPLLAGEPLLCTTSWCTEAHCQGQRSSLHHTM